MFLPIRIPEYLRPLFRAICRTIIHPNLFNPMVKLNGSSCPASSVVLEAPGDPPQIPFVHYIDPVLVLLNSHQLTLVGASAGNHAFHLVDAAGRLIRSGTFRVSAERSNTVDVGDLSPGLYW